MPAPGGAGARKAPPSRAAAAAAAAALDAPLAPEEKGPDPLGTLLTVVLRCAGIVWLAAAVWVWGRLVGYVDDTIDPAWHAPGGPWLTTLTAAVVYPVVAVGLWLVGRWGVVLWAAAVASEMVLLVVAPSLLPFGAGGLAVNVLAMAGAGTIAVLRAVRGPEQRFT